jgi:hypothetical protein
MRQVCPHCFTNNTLADELAGKEATCSYCGKTFAVSGRYTAQVTEAASAAVAGAIEPVRTSPLPEPPAPVAPPEPPPGFLPPAPPASAPAVPAGAKEIGFNVSPKLVAWVPAVALTLVFALSFFPWVGSYAGGTAVYSQRPWGAMFGGAPKRNFKLEEAGTVPGGWLDRVRSDWKLMLPFFLLLLLALAFAWADRGLRSFDPRKVPPLAKLWPYRNTIVLSCCALLLALLLAQIANGFGMERAIRAQVTAQLDAKRQAAAPAGAPAPAVDPEKAQYELEQGLAAYNLESTTWLQLAVLALALALLAAVLRPCFEARGDKPAPRFVLRY